MNPETNLPWYVVHTKVRQEQTACENLARQGYAVYFPNERRIFFVLPWKGNTLVGTTEVRQPLSQPIECTEKEKTYLLDAYRHYFPFGRPEVAKTFAGVRPLIYSANDPSRATREYALHHEGKLTTVIGGKWTTALALAKKLTEAIR